MITIIQASLIIPLIIFSVIDIKYKEIPSVLLTGTLFVYAVVNFNHIYLGILAFIFSYLLYEMEFISGIADIKLLTTIGFMFDSMLILFILVLLTPTIGTIYKFITKKFIKKSEWAFVPCLTIIYFILLTIGWAWF